MMRKRSVLQKGPLMGERKERKKVKVLSRVQLFATPWAIACQYPPSVGFPRQEYWSGVPLPSPILTLNPINSFIGCFLQSLTPLEDVLCKINKLSVGTK